MRSYSTPDGSCIASTASSSRLGKIAPTIMIAILDVWTIQQPSFAMMVRRVPHDTSNSAPKNAGSAIRRKYESSLARANHNDTIATNGTIHG